MIFPHGRIGACYGLRRYRVSRFAHSKHRWGLGIGLAGPGGAKPPEPASAAPKFVLPADAQVISIKPPIVVRELAELLYQWEKPYVFSHAKFERAFGADVTPHREAVRRTVDWFRRHPKQ